MRRLAAIVQFRVCSVIDAEAKLAGGSRAPDNVHLRGLPRDPTERLWQVSAHCKYRGGRLTYLDVQPAQRRFWLLYALKTASLYAAKSCPIKTYIAYATGVSSGTNNVRHGFA